MKRRDENIQARLPGWLRRFDADEDGTALTEFIILLPIFILVFAGIVHLATLNKTAIRLGGEAYSQMWDRAKTAQLDPPHTHVRPGRAGEAIRTNMNTFRGMQEEPDMQQIVRHETNAMAQGLRSKGHMGESYERVDRARQYVALREIDADVTSELSGVAGDSIFACRLFDDSPAADVYHPRQTGSLGGNLTAPGLRPVVAAGMRYGAVIGEADETVTVGNFDVELASYVTTLVAPHWVREDQATAVVRSTLGRVGPYENMLGISTNQPLNRESQRVGDIKGVMPAREEMQ